MPATPKSNRKLNAMLKQKHGFTAEGKSIFHSELGKKSAQTHESYLAKLKRENPEKLRQIALKGVERRRLYRMYSKGLNIDEDD